LGTAAATVDERIELSFIKLDSTIDENDTGSVQFQHVICHH